MTVLRKSEIPFQLEGNEPEQLIDAYSKDIRALLLKIESNTIVNVTGVSQKIYTKDLDRASIYRSK